MFTKPGYCSSLLSALLHDDNHCDTVISSNSESVSAHTVILRNCSEMLRDLLTTKESSQIILPPCFSSVLSDFLNILYTGSVVCYSEEDCDLLLLLCTQLGLDASIDYSLPTSEKIEITKSFQDSECLKVKTEIIINNSSEKFDLRFPKSRANRRNFPPKIISESFEGFRGRIQEEYNSSPVGPYEGPFDQNPLIPLSAQLTKSKLSYEQYINFCHSQTVQCKIFRIMENYDDISDLQKIDSLYAVEDSEVVFERFNGDKKIYYTCSKNFCEIPCPCHVCNSEDGQCYLHNMKHIDLFDEQEDLISVRSTDHFCRRETFFKNSYTLRYPGIPRNCIQCCKDLMHHICYHLDFHNSCKFCKLYQYKLFPKTVKELHEREAKEKTWYKSVCPHCDKKFVEPYAVKKHIELKHNRKNYKCKMCPRTFQSKQSLDYHNLTKHTEGPPPSHTCEVCEKTFQTKVRLNNHIKLKHTGGDKQFACDECGSMFKQKKYLNAHMLHVHGLNEKKEDYWQDLPNQYFECESCGTRFIRRADLKSHIKFKHVVQDVLHCDQCSAKFKYHKNLKQHKQEKHGSEESKSKCPECGKMFNQKRNMKRHQMLHRKK